MAAAAHAGAASPTVVSVHRLAGRWVVAAVGDVTASSTESEQAAVDAMGRKLWGDDFDRAQFTALFGMRNQWTLHRKGAAAAGGQPPAMVAARCVRFDHHGQPFKEWDLDAAGVVIACRPAGAEVWLGVTVLNHKQLRHGTALTLRLANGQTSTLKYKAAMVARLAAPAAGA